MSKFIEIFESLKKEYHFRIKSIVNLEEKIDRLEHVLGRFELLEIGRVKKTIIQDSPLDFPEIDASEVYIVDVVLGLPVSPYSLKIDLCNKLGINQSFLVVRADNEPLELETNKIKAIREIDAENDGLEPATLLSTESEMPEESLDGDLFYGDEYNSSFLKMLASQSRKRREDEIVKTNTDMTVDEEFVEDSEDYNKDIKDAPKVINRWNAPNEVEREVDKYISNAGNLDQDSSVITKRFKKASGEKTASKNSDSIRK